MQNFPYIKDEKEKMKPKLVNQNNFWWEKRFLFEEQRP